MKLSHFVNFSFIAGRILLWAFTVGDLGWSFLHNMEDSVDICTSPGVPPRLLLIPRRLYSQGHDGQLTTPSWLLLGTGDQQATWQRCQQVSRREGCTSRCLSLPSDLQSGGTGVPGNLPGDPVGLHTGQWVGAR